MSLSLLDSHALGVTLGMSVLCFFVVPELYFGPWQTPMLGSWGCLCDSH